MRLCPSASGVVPGPHSAPRAGHGPGVYWEIHPPIPRRVVVSPPVARLAARFNDLIAPSQPTRRQFLQNATAATALLPLAGASAFGSVAKSDRPRFAVIGLRNQGVLIAKSAIWAQADIAALVDVDRGVLNKVAGAVAYETGARDNPKQKTAEGEEKVVPAEKPDLCNDYREILKRDDIDAVMIATPDHWHTKMAVDAMRAGKDVYCEKPLTLTIDEGKVIERTVAETGRVFQVGTMQRSMRVFLQAVAMVRSGRVGLVKKVTCGIDAFRPSPSIPIAPVPDGLDWERWLGPAPYTEYRALPETRAGYGGGVPLYSNCHYAFRNWHEYSGGKMTDWGAHHIDIACWALGLEQGDGPSKITPLDFEMACEHRGGYPVVNDRYNSAIKFTIQVDLPGGVEMLIKSEGDNGILFEGTKGRFFVNRRKIVGRPIEDLENDPLPEGVIDAVYGRKRTGNHVANFIDGMRAREQPISDVWSHNRMLEICHLSNIAMRLDRSVDWDPLKREIVGNDEANSFLARESRDGYRIDD